MSRRMTVTVALFGAFRGYLPDPSLELSLENGATVSDVKKALASLLADRVPHFNDAGLVAESAIADARTVLADHIPVVHGASLAVLPPVCGG